METKCCKNCGGPLNVGLSHCEYCRTPLEKLVDYSTNEIRYSFGWTDPREVYGLRWLDENTDKPYDPRPVYEMTERVGNFFIGIILGCGLIGGIAGYLSR